MKFLDANNFNEGEMDWDSVSRKDWYYIRHRIAELKTKNIEAEADTEELTAENLKLRTEINELKASQKADSTEASNGFNFGALLTEVLDRTKELEIDWPDTEDDEFVKLSLLNTRLPRRFILNEMFATLDVDEPDRPQYTSPTVYQGRTPTGDIKADIEMIRSHGGALKWKIAFLRMYGVQCDIIENIIDDNMFERMLDLCNVRGTVQVQLPFADSKDQRNEMEYIRQVCDELLEQWDWENQFVNWRIEELEMRLKRIRVDMDI